MRRPRLPPASWLLLLAAAATQCPDTDETLDLGVVLSDAQGFRRNDVRWSLSAASSMEAYAAGALVGGGNATLDAGAELALPTLCAEPGNYWLAFQRLPDECVADIELLACATPTPAPTAVPSTWAPSLRPDDVQDAVDSYADLGAHFPGTRRARRPSCRARSRRPGLRTSPRRCPFRSPRATHHRWRRPARRRRSPQRRRRQLRRQSRRPRPRRCRRRGRRLNRLRTVVKPVAAAYDQPDPRARARAYINTIAPAVVGTRPGADVRPDRTAFWSTHLKALSATVGAPDDRAADHLDALRRADEPSFRNTIITPTRAHAQADGVAAHGGPDAAGPLLRLHPNPDGPAPLLVNRGRHLRPEHRRDL